MSSKKQALPPEYQNPFERAGFDKEIVEALITSGDQSLNLALNGLRRTVARALHPDVAASSLPEKTTRYFDNFLQATSKITHMDAEDRNKLARAYVQGGKRTRKKTLPEFESKDLHDGSLLQNIIEMVSDSGENIVSTKNKRMLIRPMDYSDTKPDNYRGKPMSWYPPGKSKVTLLDTDADGNTNYHILQQTSFTKMLRKEHHRNDVNELYWQKIKSLTSTIYNNIRDIMPDHIYAELKRPSDKLVVDLKNGIYNVFLGTNGEHLGSVASVENVDDLQDGIYTLGCGSVIDPISDKRTINLHDTYYSYDDDYSNNDNINLLLIGSCDKSSINLMRSAIYPNFDEQGFESRLALPTVANITGISMSPIPEKMYKYVQRDYTPQLGPIEEDESSRYLLAIDESQSLYTPGQFIIITNNSQTTL